MQGKSWTSGTIRRQELGKDHKKGGAAALNITYQAILSQWGGEGRSPWEADRSRIVVHVSQWPVLTANAWEFARTLWGSREVGSGFQAWAKLTGLLFFSLILGSLVILMEKESRSLVAVKELTLCRNSMEKADFHRNLTWHWKLQVSFSVSPPSPLSQRRPKSWLQ